MFIIGHRGAKGVEPENTLRAVRAGMACADYVEVDVRLSHDGIPVVMHDLLLKRTTNGTGPVNEYTVKELKTLDAGGGEQIPTLEEVCSLLAGRCGLFLEIKEPGSEGPVCRVLKKNPIKNLCIVSFHPESIASAQALLPGVKTGIIYARALEDLAGAAAGLGVYAILLKFGLLTGDLVKECRKRNLVILSWTPNSPEEFRVADDLKIDGIATDYPCRARHYFRAL
jgi:glycerophosphoryl diester phosphodiesterase